MALNIYFVRSDSVDGDNQDLLVRAAASEDCPAIWREAFGLDDTDEPQWVGQVPGVVSTSATPGAIDWGSINPN